MNVIYEMPEDISARKQYRRNRFWVMTARYVALVPILLLLVVGMLNRADELPYYVVFIGMMMSALGIIASVFTYRGYQPTTKQLCDSTNKRK